MTETATDDDCVGRDTLAGARGSTDGATAGRASGAARRRRVETNTVEWVIAALLGLLLLRFLWSLARNENLLPGMVLDHLLDADVLAGVWLTVRLTVLVFVAASAIGLVVDKATRSGNAVLRGIAAAYVWIFGSIPVLVQLLLWSNIALVFPDLTFGVPGVHVDTVSAVTPVYATIVGLALSVGAYAADVIGRHRDPARGAGSPGLTEPLGGVLVATLQATSLASVLSINDLLGVVGALEERSHLIIPLLTVAAIWYLVLVTAIRGGTRLVARALSDGRSEADEGGSDR